MNTRQYQIVGKHDKIAMRCRECGQLFDADKQTLSDLLKDASIHDLNKHRDL